MGLTAKYKRLEDYGIVAVGIAAVNIVYTGLRQIHLSP
jgi:hypothetical protein